MSQMIGPVTGDDWLSLREQALADASGVVSEAVSEVLGGI